MFKLDPVYRDATQLEIDQAVRNRALNDAFRRDLSLGGLHLSMGIRHLPPLKRAAVIDAVKTFEDFSFEDDPYEERNFGTVFVNGERYLWDIAYYDLDLIIGSLDPSDPAFTIRVMTIAGQYESISDGKL